MEGTLLLWPGLYLDKNRGWAFHFLCLSTFFYCHFSLFMPRSALIGTKRGSGRRLGGNRIIGDYRHRHGPGGNRAGVGGGGKLKVFVFLPTMFFFFGRDVFDLGKLRVEGAAKGGIQTGSGSWGGTEKSEIRGNATTPGLFRGDDFLYGRTRAGSGGRGVVILYLGRGSG